MADAFERLIPYLDRCRGLTDMKTKRLVITVLRSSALDIYRKNKREQIQVSLDAEDFLDRGVNTIDDYMKRRDCEELAGKIVDLLPEIYAGVIRLRYFYDMDVEKSQIYWESACLPRILRIPIFILRLPELDLTAAPMIPYSFMI